MWSGGGGGGGGLFSFPPPPPHLHYKIKNHATPHPPPPHNNHPSHTIKILPPLMISDADCKWIEDAFSAVIAGAHRVPGAVWSLGKTLIDNAVRVRSPAREKASAQV